MIWANDFWSLVDCGAWAIAALARRGRYSNTCSCGAFIDSHEAIVTHSTWGQIHVRLQAGDTVTVSLRDFVDMNPELFVSVALPERAEPRSTGCQLCNA